MERALVVSAHPDDVDFGAAGTVAAWTDAGVEVVYCLVTDGDGGGFDPDVPREEIPRIRREEQTAAAAVVGVTDLRFLGYPDGRVEVTLDLRKDLTRVVRQVRPDVVVCPTPQRNWRSIYASHPDHLATGEATLCAVYPDARNPFAWPDLLADGLEAHTVGEVWLQASQTPDHFVDITEQFDRKVAALRCHVSQHADPDGLDGRMRGWGEAVAAAAGLPGGRLAEGFQRVVTA